MGGSDAHPVPILEPLERRDVPFANVGRLECSVLAEVVVVVRVLYSVEVAYASVACCPLEELQDALERAVDAAHSVAFLVPIEAVRHQKAAFPGEAFPYVADPGLEVHSDEPDAELMADAFPVAEDGLSD